MADRKFKFGEAVEHHARSKDYEELAAKLCEAEQMLVTFSTELTALRSEIAALTQLVHTAIAMQPANQSWKMQPPTWAPPAYVAPAPAYPVSPYQPSWQWGGTSYTSNNTDTSLVNKPGHVVSKEQLMTLAKMMTAESSK